MLFINLKPNNLIITANSKIISHTRNIINNSLIKIRGNRHIKNNFIFQIRIRPISQVPILLNPINKTRNKNRIENLNRIQFFQSIFIIVTLSQNIKNLINNKPKIIKRILKMFVKINMFIIKFFNII